MAGKNEKRIVHDFDNAHYVSNDGNHGSVGDRGMLIFDMGQVPDAYVEQVYDLLDEENYPQLKYLLDDHAVSYVWFTHDSIVMKHF
jgi:hypothetical protein